MPEPGVLECRMGHSKHARTSAKPAAHTHGSNLGELLVRAQLRRTPARLALLQVLSDATRAMSHADVEAALASPIDRVTLYRSLDSFVEAGLLHKQVGADRISRFALVDGVDHEAHAHFHCDDCGSLYCLPQKPPRVAHLPEGFAAEGAMLQIHGRCPQCAGAPAAAPKAR